MGKPALDYHVCHRGFYAAIEAKAHGKHMTDRQVETAYEVIAAKGSVFVIDSEDSDDFKCLQWWLEQPHTGTFGGNWINESDLYKHRRTK